MAANIEMIKVITSLVPSYDGTAEKLNSVVSSLTALETLINDQNRVLSIQVILSKFEGKARSAVGENPPDIATIIDRLKQRCSEKVSPDVILAKLNTLKQTNTLNNYTDEIEKLTLKLESAYITDNIPIETATKMATKAGVKALAKGVKNSETQLLLKAGQFDTLSAAICKAAENESSETKQNDKQVFKLQYSKGRGNYRGNNRGYHNNRGNYSRGRNGNYTYNRYQNYQQRPPYQSNQQFQQRPQYQGRNTQQNQSNYQTRGRGGRNNTYVVRNDNQSEPQRHAENSNNSFLGQQLEQDTQ